jgi:hypothetical protein
VSDFPSVGVEEEFLLVDPRTGEPAPLNNAVAAEASGAPPDRREHQRTHAMSRTMVAALVGGAHF